jgi:hypothetical protein
MSSSATYDGSTNKHIKQKRRGWGKQHRALKYSALNIKICGQITATLVVEQFYAVLICDFYGGQPKNTKIPSVYYYGWQLLILDALHSKKMHL